MKTGYQFNGWYTDNGTFQNQVTSVVTTTAQNLELYPSWTANDYTISFNSNEGTAVQSITQGYETSVLAPADPLRNGYTFAGWYTDNGTFLNEYTFSTMPLNGITLYADWEMETYTIIYLNVKGLSIATPTSYNISSDTITLQTLSYENCVFNGWTSNNKAITQIPTGSYGNITLTAQWEELELIIDFSGLISGVSNTSNFVANLTDLSVPLVYDGIEVTSISSGVFSGFGNLTEITLPFVGSTRGNTGSTESVFGYIFGSTSYTNGRSTDQLYAAGYAYSVCVPSKLTTIIILDETVFGYGAFYNMSSVTTIVIPGTVTSCRKSAFTNCSKLTDIKYSGTIEQWCNITFQEASAHPLYDYSNQKSFYLYDTIEEDYFELVDLVIPNTITTIKNYTFYSFFNVKTIILSENVQTIGVYSFYNCAGVSSITLPSSLITIGNYAFYECSGLETIIIYDSVETIGNSSFSLCSLLETVNYTGTEEQWNAIEIGTSNEPLTSATMVYNFS